MNEAQNTGNCPTRQPTYARVSSLRHPESLLHQVPEHPHRTETTSEIGREVRQRYVVKKPVTSVWNRTMTSASKWQCATCILPASSDQGEDEIRLCAEHLSLSWGNLRCKPHHSSHHDLGGFGVAEIAEEQYSSLVAGVTGKMKLANRT